MKISALLSRSHPNISAMAHACPEAGAKMSDFNLRGNDHKKLAIRALVALFACAISSPFALAQATRTWVSGVGDDVNPCSRTAPGKTFAGAISKTAAGGEINVIDPGGYGGVTITKSMTIDGEGSMASILVSGTNGVVINAGANGVVNLRNLSLNGNATGLVGVKILAAAEVNIERCVIAKFATRGIEISCATPCRVNIRDTIIRDCAGGSVCAKPNSVLSLKGCSLLASQYGLRVDGAATANAEDCVMSGNLGNGVVVDTSVVAGQAMVSLNKCLLTDNGHAGVLSQGPTSTARLSNNTITGNVNGIFFGSGGALLSFGNNQISGNTTDGSPTGTVLLK
jgi:hypothetical protein